MTQHKIAHYPDDRKWVPYCKVCSAEGDKLLEDCQGEYKPMLHFKEVSKEEFLKIYPNPLDQSKPSAK